jgi:hypothetical protein
MQIEIKHHQLPNLGFIMFDIPPVALSYLDKVCADIQANPDQYKPWNDHLVGHIQDQYSFDPSSEFREFIQQVAAQYTSASTVTRPKPFELDSVWANFQKRHEYNPSHDHDGDLSFVIWVQIPYDLKEELAVYPDARGQRHSCFEFKYTTILGKVCTYTLPVDQDWRGKMIMFPGKLVHQVNPFTTTDGVRISVSGNLI